MVVNSLVHVVIDTPVVGLSHKVRLHTLSWITLHLRLLWRRSLLGRLALLEHLGMNVNILFLLLLLLGRVGLLLLRFYQYRLRIVVLGCTLLLLCL